MEGHGRTRLTVGTHARSGHTTALTCEGGIGTRLRGHVRR